MITRSPVSTLPVLTVPSGFITDAVTPLGRLRPDTSSSASFVTTETLPAIFLSHTSLAEDVGTNVLYGQSFPGIAAHSYALRLSKYIDFVTASVFIGT